jgi:Cu/Ag efflux pump CusA
LPLLGARLLPDFRENYLIAHAGLRPGISLAETARVGRNISKALAAIPGVKSVAEQIGRAENGQDPDTPDRSEFEVQIDPQRGLGAAQIDKAIREVFDDYPNQLVEIYSVLAERIGETLSGESAPFSISVFGADLDADDQVAGEIAEALRKLPDSGNVRLVVPSRQPQLHLQLKPEQLALYGLQAADVLDTVNAAFHGSVVAQLSQADRSVPVAVRIDNAADDPQAAGALLLRGRDGAPVPLSKVATLEMQSARSIINHQDGLRRQIVVATPKTSNQTGYADAARKVIGAIDLPAGVYLRYGGEAQAQGAAARELLLHSAAAFVLIVLLLALAFGSARHVLLILLALPSTLIGGVIAVVLTGGTLTLGAMVGFVALFGMAARNTILLVSHYDHLVAEEGESWNLATALRGAEERLTPVLLTALLTALALLPVAWQAHQPGHEIEGPMAIVILGGLVSSTLVSLLLIPPLAARWLRPGTGISA